MLRRPAALLSFSITARNLWSLLGFRFAPNLASCTTLQLSSSSTAGYRTRTRFRAMSTSVNSTSINEKDEQVFQDFKLLNAVNDRYGGVIVEVREAMDSALFGSVLRASIAQWRHQHTARTKFLDTVILLFGDGKLQDKKGVWIKLPIQHVNLVEAAVKEGFWFHHAEPNYLMLCYWIPEGTHTLPANASHRIGIGAFVMNEKREVLVVQESTGRFQGTGVWKFPTGVVNEGEDICAAAVREVKEETAVDTKFIEILAFRQSHKAFFDKSDIFFLCLLEPLSSEVQKQETEIEAAKWMPFEEYKAQPFVQKHELLKYIANICLAKKDGNYSGFSPVPTTSPFSDEKNYMYFNTTDLNGQ
ncbi:nudix hydrolase 2-like [Gossypium australe]|uniref:Nudix hydrolase 2-like n=1 Tax=Gossypium australe TaxID=47621 RepID=A0A5B6W9U7_9ROSI|nr:nudix hydrolase 2-like [Gossypium australe]